MGSRRDEAPTEELSWNSWVGRRPGEAGPTSYPITTETAEPRVRPGGPGGTPKQPGGHRSPVSADGSAVKPFASTALLKEGTGD